MSARLRRLHYGWVVAGVTFVILLVGAGVRATPGVLMVPLETEFGWNRTAISFAIAVNIALFGLIGPFAAAVMNRFGGTPAERREVYRDRSPLFQVDKLTVPVLVHIADNDEDVTIEEGMQLVDALRARKPSLSTTKVYASPPGGHSFDRRVDPRTLEPVNTPDQRDSWTRVWAFLEQSLQTP